MIAATPTGPLEAQFLRLVELPALSPLVATGAVLTALGIGAAHALAPGHGKAIAAAYLAGARGRPRDALLLGGAVAAMHTVSVVALGLALHLLAAGSRALDRLGAWLLLAAGLLVLAVGIASVARLLRRHRARSHDHAHAPGHAHHHLPDLPGGVAPLSRRGLVVIGLSGGLLPSPSAFLVLTTALVTGRAAFGFALVGAFSLGLAATLSGIGLAVLHGRDVVRRRAAGSARLAAAAGALPLASALAVTGGGVWLTLTAARGL